jgi:NADH:ubiquinone oxidoreductase subunit C
VKKIKVRLENLKKEIKGFYSEREFHFLTINALSLSEELIELQYIFSLYSDNNDITIIYAEIKPDDRVESITDVIPSAIISQREMVDMFGLNIENSEAGLYLDSDSQQHPLR